MPAIQCRGKKQGVGILHLPLHAPLDTLIFIDLCAATAARFYVCQAREVKYLDATKLSSNNVMKISSLAVQHFFLSVAGLF